MKIFKKLLCLLFGHKSWMPFSNTPVLKIGDYICCHRCGERIRKITKIEGGLNEKE